MGEVWSYNSTELRGKLSTLPALPYPPTPDARQRLAEWMNPSPTLARVIVGVLGVAAGALIAVLLVIAFLWVACFCGVFAFEGSLHPRVSDTERLMFVAVMMPLSLIALVVGETFLVLEEMAAILLPATVALFTGAAVVGLVLTLFLMIGRGFAALIEHENRLRQNLQPMAFE